MFIDPMPYFILIVCIGFALGYVAGRLVGRQLYPRRRRKSSAPPVLFEYPRTRHE